MTDQYSNPGINNPGSSINVSANRQLTTDDDLIVITAGTPTLTLPNAATVRGIILEIKSVTGTGTVNTLSGQTIDGAASFSFVVAQQALSVISDGSNWRIINNFGQTPPAVTGTGRPTINADFIGQIYLDTAHGFRAYLATSVGNADADWKRTSAFDSRFEMAPIFEDFTVNAGLPGGWFSTTANGGTFGSTTPQISNPGVCRLAVTNALNSLSLLQNGRTNFLFGGGEAFSRWNVRIEDEATAGDPYTLRWGYLDSITAAAPADGVYWEIDETSSNLIAVAMATGVPTSVTTSTPYDFGVNHHDYSIRVNPLGTSAEFFVDGTSVATVGGLPNGTLELFGLGAQLLKTAALGGSIGTIIDLVEATQDIDVER